MCFLLIGLICLFGLGAVIFVGMTFVAMVDRLAEIYIEKVMERHFSYYFGKEIEKYVYCSKKDKFYKIRKDDD